MVDEINHVVNWVIRAAVISLLCDPLYFVKVFWHFISIHFSLTNPAHIHYLCVCMITYISSRLFLRPLLVYGRARETCWREFFKRKAGRRAWMWRVKGVEEQSWIGTGRKIVTWYGGKVLRVWLLRESSVEFNIRWM